MRDPVTEGVVNDVAAQARRSDRRRRRPDSPAARNGCAAGGTVGPARWDTSCACFSQCPMKKSLRRTRKAASGASAPRVAQHIIAQFGIGQRSSASRYSTQGWRNSMLDDRPILMGRPIVKGALDHAGTALRGDRARPVGAQRVEHDHIVAPGQRLQAGRDIDLLVESQNQNRNLTLPQSRSSPNRRIRRVPYWVLRKRAQDACARG